MMLRQIMKELFVKKKTYLEPPIAFIKFAPWSYLLAPRLRRTCAYSRSVQILPVSVILSVASRRPAIPALGPDTPP